MANRRESRCVWLIPSEDPNARYLIPGCMSRVQDWDAECTCTSTAEELDEAEAKIVSLERQLAREQDMAQAFRSVLIQQPDSWSLVEKAYTIADEQTRRREEVERQNEADRESGRI